MEVCSSENPCPSLGLIDHFARQYGFDKSLDVDGVGVRILDQTRQIFPFFELTLENEADYLDIIDRAWAELIHVSSNFIDQLLEQRQQRLAGFGRFKDA